MSFAQSPPATSAAPDRSDEILGRIRLAFADKGFDGASMQDLARAAGMSVGNFYRYFPSKAAIVEAIVGRDMAEIERNFADFRGAGDPTAALRAKIAARVSEPCHEDGKLWAEINAAAHRKEEIARICCRMEDLVAENLIALFSRIGRMQIDACRQRYGAHARFVVLMVKTAATRKERNPDPDLDALILRSINHTLDEILAATEKG